jgi:serine/threonine protein kinase
MITVCPLGDSRMASIEKHRGNNVLVDNDAGQLGEAPTVRAIEEDEPNTVTAEGIKRPNPFRDLDAATTALTMPSLEAGTVVKHYEFLRKIGTGGMGTVFLARDTRLGRLVAVKLLLKYTGPAAYRFLAEARTTALCRHENIVVVYDVDEYAGYPYMVLEYIEGRTLRHAIIDPGRDRVAFAIDAMLSVTRALIRAHEMGIVHRDLKPENILLSNDGQIKALDFGIASGCILTDTSSPMIDWLSKNESVMGLPLTRCRFLFSRETSTERQTQYFQWLDSMLPELRGALIEEFLKSGKTDDARTALAIKATLGAEKTSASGRSDNAHRSRDYPK